MKYALYWPPTQQVMQWLDTDVYDPGEPAMGQLRVALDPDDLPAGFDLNPSRPITGWWVVGGQVTNVQPPRSLMLIAQDLRTEIAARRAAGIAAGVVLADGTVFAVSEADLVGRVAPVALGTALLGSAGMTVKLPSGFETFTSADLQDAFALLMERREGFFNNEGAHCIAIAALLAAEDRDGLEAYDVSTGWPAPETP